jgi:hypothetical protein
VTAPTRQAYLDFSRAGLDLVPQIAREPSLDMLRAYFEARTAFWPYPYASNEWNPGNFDSLAGAGAARRFSTYPHRDGLIP